MNIPWTHRDGVDPDAPAPADFPQRAWCFGSDWLDGGLVEALGAPAGPGSPRHAEIENVHYIPGKQFQVVYRLGIGDGPGHGPDAGPPRVTLNFAPATAADVDPADAQPGHWLADARARAFLWPDDPGGLPLSRWLSPAQVRHDMPAALARTLPADARLRAGVLSYAPGERLALRWRCEGSDAPGWVMKAQRGGVADTRALHALWRDPSRRWGMAEPLDEADASRDLRWERFLPGERLEAAAAREGWSGVLQQAATALVALHRQPLSRLEGLDSLPRQSCAVVHRQLDHKVMRRIRAALPTLAERAQALADRLGAQAPTSDGRPAALLHGDLHTGNLLRQPDGRIAFIDLDSLMVGDPAWDLALLSTRLMLVALLDPAQGRTLAAPLAAWPQTYLDAGGDPAVLPSYRWHVAAMLLSRQVKTCVRHHAPGMTGLASALLEQAEALGP